MMLNLKNISINDCFVDVKEPLIIAGPCSAETEKQVLDTAIEIAKLNKVSLFRAGLWKPRSRPGFFEGVGSKGLQWLKRVKAETHLKVTTEVASAQHVEECLLHGIDVLWIGARTTANPFSVQEIADALKGVDIPVMIKNPINPDIALWMGALERINGAGITKLMAIHRGFSSFEKSIYRNVPKWEIPIELRSYCSNLPMICDPSHIAGNKEWITEVSQKALDLDMQGLMIETHITPEKALSDAFQQITPEGLRHLLSSLIIRHPDSKNRTFTNHLEKLRNTIDELDKEIFHLFSIRMQNVDKIGKYKKQNNVTIFQLKRWKDILSTRSMLGDKLGLPDEFIQKLLQIIHKESIRRQTEIMNKDEN